MKIPHAFRIGLLLPLISLLLTGCWTTEPAQLPGGRSAYALEEDRKERQRIRDEEKYQSTFSAGQRQRYAELVAKDKKRHRDELKIMDFIKSGNIPDGPSKKEKQRVPATKKSKHTTSGAMARVIAVDQARTASMTAAREASISAARSAAKTAAKTGAKSAAKESSKKAASHAAKPATSAHPPAHHP